MPLRDARYFLIGLLVIFTLLLFAVVSGFLAALVIGVVLAALTYPVYQILLKTFSNRKGVAAFTTTLLVLVLIILPILGLLTLLANEAFGLIAATRTDFSTTVDPIIQIAEPFAEQFNFDLRAFLNAQLAPMLKNLGLLLSREVGNLVSNAVSLFLNFFVMAVTLFYMLRDGKAFSNFLIDFSPLKTSEELNLYRAFRDAGKAIFFGNFISALAQGTLGGIGFALFGIPSPVLWGAVMSFLALIPFLGPYLIFVPAAIYLFATGTPWIGTIFLIYNIIIVSTVDNFIKPIFIGGKINVHPLLILLSILGGIEFFGLIGIIYGPLIAAIFLALLKTYHGYRRAEQTAQ